MKYYFQEIFIQKEIYAEDYVTAMWKMLQQKPDDYVISTGK